MATAKETFLELLSALPEDVPHIHESAWIDPKTVPFSADVRQMCADNRCGKYGSCWTCPPGCGDWEMLRDKYQAYKEAFVFTTCHELEDSFDFEGMQEAGAAHKRLDDLIADKLGAFVGQYVHLGAGACGICTTCTYPDAPCRFPERLMPTVEGYGIYVNKLAESAGLEYINGPDTVTYFGMLLF